MTTQRDEGASSDRCAYVSCQARTDGSLFCAAHKLGGYTVDTPHPSVAYVDGRYVEQRPAPAVTNRSRVLRRAPSRTSAQPPGSARYEVSK